MRNAAESQIHICQPKTVLTRKRLAGITSIVMAYDGTKFRWVNRRVHTKNVVFGEVLYEPGGSCGPRVQRDFELILLHSGEGRVTLGGERVQFMKSGTVSLFVPGDHNYFEYAEVTHHSWCTIRPEFMPKNLRRQLTGPLVSVSVSRLMRSLMEEALKLKIGRAHV